MTVQVLLYATLAIHAPTGRAGEAFPLDLDDATSVAGLIDRLGLPDQDVHLVILNGRVTHDRSASLRSGDRIGLFPPVGGG
jgi:sulfur-carrier protein